MTTETSKLYGVSSGNGNNGVSQMWPDYYVRTNAPWTLARAAILSLFKVGKGQSWALRNVDVDGDSEYTIYATLANPPCEDTPDGEYPDIEDESEASEAEDGRNWSEHNGSWLIVEVFPETEDPREGRPIFDSLLEAFGADVLALAEKD